MGLVARELGHVTLEGLAFDGTQLRASSRRSGTRKVADWATARVELAKKFAQLQAQAESHDAADDALDDADERLLGEGVITKPDPAMIAKQLAQITRQISAIDGALAEIERVKEAGETVRLTVAGDGRCGERTDCGLRCDRADG